MAVRRLPRVWPSHFLIVHIPNNCSEFLWLLKAVPCMCLSLRQDVSSDAGASSRVVWCARARAIPGVLIRSQKRGVQVAFVVLRYVIQVPCRKHWP